MKLLEHFLKIKHAESDSTNIPFESWLFRQYSRIQEEEEIPWAQEIYVLMQYRAGEYGDDLPEEKTPMLELNWTYQKEAGKLQAGDECDMPGRGPSVIQSIVGPHAFNFHSKGHPEDVFHSTVVFTGDQKVVITTDPIAQAVQKLPALTPLSRKPSIPSSMKVKPTAKKAAMRVDEVKPTPLIRRTRSG